MITENIGRILSSLVSSLLDRHHRLIREVARNAPSGKSAHLIMQCWDQDGELGAALRARIGLGSPGGSALGERRLLYPTRIAFRRAGTVVKIIDARTPPWAAACMMLLERVIHPSTVAGDCDHAGKKARNASRIDDAGGRQEPAWTVATSPTLDCSVVCPCHQGLAACCADVGPCANGHKRPARQHLAEAIGDHGWPLGFENLQ